MMACGCGRVDGPCAMGDEDKWDEDGNRFRETDVFGLLPDEMMRASCRGSRAPTWPACRAPRYVCAISSTIQPCGRACVGPRWLCPMCVLWMTAAQMWVLMPIRGWTISPRSTKTHAPSPTRTAAADLGVGRSTKETVALALCRVSSARCMPHGATLGRSIVVDALAPVAGRPRPGHVVRGERIGTAALIVIEVGDLDDQGRLAGFGLRATCARPSDAAPWRGPNGHGARGTVDVSKAWVACALHRVPPTPAALWMASLTAVVFARCRTVPHTLAPTASIHTSSSNINAQEYPIPCHAVEVSGCWRAGKAHGRLVQATSCGDVWVSLWNRGVLTGIESLLLPPRPATDGRPAFGGVRIEGVSWRVEDVASAVRGAAISKGLFGRCVIAVPADAKALDIYLDYVRAGHPCLSADMAAAVLGAGTRIRAALTVRPNLDQ
ncbi:hypothetical protein pclt_cds_1066 [Pandoravirus celtis]|uniref:Uncharacterized protein n=1 Tax=Pandoravirus celtis TaxID=2568002 RepID=A0A4D6EKH6_9VIRU|nr:hypothetical protein pclt_cds_1066 [Pandoravirus celtis]